MFIIFLHLFDRQYLEIEQHQDQIDVSISLEKILHLKNIPHKVSAWNSYWNKIVKVDILKIKRSNCSW